jgi:LysR family transcriptional regulator, glycine cleavage system transcriptional activator
MVRRLPPLNALRCFEAAGRHLSFTRAADELHVTQAAISHQIRALEEWLGAPLFRRQPRRLLLTDAGQHYLRAVSAALDEIAAATDQARVQEQSASLTVSVLPSFAAKWLVPRLPSFQALHPGIDVYLSASNARADFRRDNVDVAIRHGKGPYPALYQRLLFGEEFFPVCSPELAVGLVRPEDLARATLLHDQHDDDGDPAADWPDWPAWLKAAGVTGMDATRGPLFSDAAMMIQAAMAGQGVALARTALVADDIAAGRLARPFALALPSDWAYWFLCEPAAAERPKIKAFREWLLAEAARYRNDQGGGA